jgi:hypothetical protein
MSLIAMPEPLTLTRQQLETFVACRRRFQLRYAEPYPWPQAPHDLLLKQALQRGEQFHRMLHRHFLGLPVSVPGDDALLASWWRRFEEADLDLPTGLHLPELAITVPAGSHLLTGRLDLLVLHDGKAHIFDWKTGKVPGEAALRDRWQTWFYAALVAAAGTALPAQQQPIAPEDITITYWSPLSPVEPVRLAYSAAVHDQTWRTLLELFADIDVATQTAGIWSLTADLALCARCRYRVLCGRQSVAPQTRSAEELELPAPPELEPDLP